MRGTFRRTFASAAILMVLTWAAPFAEGQAAISFDLPAQPLADSLRALGSQTNMNVLFDPPLVAGHQAPALKARLTVNAALTRLLAGTKIRHEFLNEKTIVLESLTASLPRGKSVSNGAQAGRGGQFDATEGSNGDFHAAQADQQESTADLGSPKASQPAFVDDASDSRHSRALEEVIVTASKRSERVQDIAVSISALASEEIRQRGLVSMEDYLRSVPGLSYVDRGVANNSIVIRGLTADAQNYTDMGGTVGIYLGDIPLAGLAVSGNNADIKLIDMERVEVIRGPQGTLYGDGSLGGTVRNIPAQPNLERFQGAFKAGYSQTEGEGGANNELQAVINVPLVDDSLALRGVGYRYRNSGYIRNVAASDPSFSSNAAALGYGGLAIDQENVGNSQYTGGRITALWLPTARLRTSLMILSQDLEQHGLPEVQLRLDTFEQTRLQISDQYRGGSERLTDDISLANLDIQYDLGWSTIFSSTSYVEEKGLLVRDIGSVFGNIPTPQSVDLTSRAFIEEVRLTSQFEGPFEFLAGLYINDGTKNRYSDAYRLATPTLPTTTFDARFRKATVTQRALFGEASYNVTEKLKATVGARTFEYDQEFVTTSFITATPSTATLENKNKSGETYKLNLTYKPGAESLLYAQWAEGFRLGVPLAGPPAAVCDLNGDGLIDGTNLSALDRSLSPDSLQSYELGTKFDLLERRLSVSASIYRNNWTGIPVVVLVPCGFGQFVNAGEARTEGLEFESSLALLNGLSVRIGGGYVDAKLTKDAPGVGVKGNRLPGSPRYNVTAGVQYRFAIADRPSSVRADYLKVGGFYNNLAGTGREIGNYDLINLRAGFELGRVDLEVFANNLTNTADLTWIDSVFGGGDARASRLRPRTVGLSARFHF